MKYYAIQCSKCGKWTGRQVKEKQGIQQIVFTCSYCRVRHKMKHKHEFGLQLRANGPYNSVDVSKVVAHLNGGKIDRLQKTD